MTILPPFHATTARQAHQSGFTLIEMMISITIGLGILAGLVGVLAGNASNSRSNDRTAELMSNGRYALHSIRQELRQAGFRGYTWVEPTPPAGGTWTAPADASGCYGTEAGASAGAFVSNMGVGIWGANNVNPFENSCIPTANYAADNDVLVLRRVDQVPTPTASLQVNTVYMISAFERGQVFRANAEPASPPPFSGAPPIPLASFAVRNFVYYIRTFTVSATENPLVPALVRVSLGTDGNMSSELVASGIERMHVRYGVRDTDLRTRYLDAGVDPLDTPSSGELSISWDVVNSVQIWLLARNTTVEPGYTNTTPYTMGDRSYPPVNDGFRRQLFTAIVQLRN